MKELPILFSSPMVRALLAGTKTQTRRIVKPQPSFCSDEENSAAGHTQEALGDKCPYGAPGDRLWVRETWAPRGVNQIGGGPLTTLIAYRTDGAMHALPHREIARDPHNWHPSIFMPRWASRLTLEITAVRVERLQDISEVDAKAEDGCWVVCGPRWGTYRAGYHWLWESINGPGSWALNPWIWVITFKRITP